jgi:hypothetical protein
MVAVFGLALGAGVTLEANSQSSSDPVLSGAHRLMMTSSATGVQSFAWILDDVSNVVTFCYSTASPQLGPQFDFTCRRHPMPSE